MTIARQFTVLISIPFLLLVGFAVALTYEFADLSAEEARMIANLQHTAILSQQLASGNSEQTDWLQRQLVHLDPSFIERSMTLNYALGEKYTEYLKLDIGDQERMTVEAAKALQSEDSILSMQVYEQLRSGDQAQVSVRLGRLFQLQGQIRSEFEQLNGLQMEKLRAAVNHLNHSATAGLISVFVLVAALIAGAGTAAVVLRKRVLQSVRAILDASSRMRQGDFAARAPVNQTDEFGQLMQGFNFMAESLAESHAGLERKVEERTQQLRDMQDQLIRSEKMSAVGLLVSGVAHELNNPLAAIRGLVELARTAITTREGNARGITLLEDVDSQVGRCRRIIVNLLQFARQPAPHVEIVDLNALLDQVLRLREYELQTSNTTLVREFDPARPTVCADEDKLRQVFLNLLNNAHDAIRETHRAGTIWVRTRTESTSAIVDFRDNGPGFTDAARAFDPFYTTKEAGKGTGLGLSVCHGIVQEHHGEIRAKNWADGARVIVTLPIGDPTELAACGPQTPSTPETSRAEPETTRDLRALVVDDEEMLLRVQIAFLLKMGITAVGAATGEEGMRYLQGHHVDLVISDVRMPGPMDGVQLYEWVRKHQPDVAKTFVFSSGDLVGLNLGDFFQKHAVLRVAKPFQYREFAHVIRQVLNPEVLQS